MSDSRTVAWILLSVELASGNDPANYRSISSVADGINHAVPTQRELQCSLSWLVRAGLVLKTGSHYSISPDGKSFIAEYRQAHDTLFKLWAALTQAIGDMDKSSGNPLLSVSMTADSGTTVVRG